MEGGAVNTCLRVLKETMDSELLTCLLKFIEYFPDYLSALSRMLLRFFWTTFVETAVYIYREKHMARRPVEKLLELIQVTGSPKI